MALTASEETKNFKQSVAGYLITTLGSSIKVDFFQPQFDPGTETSWIRLFALSDIVTNMGPSGSKLCYRHQVLLQVSLFERLDERRDPYLADMDDWAAKIRNALHAPRGIPFYNFWPAGVFNSASTTPAWSNFPSISVLSLSEGTKQLKDDVWHLPFRVEVEYYSVEA